MVKIGSSDLHQRWHPWKSRTSPSWWCFPISTDLFPISTLSALFMNTSFIGTRFLNGWISICKSKIRIVRLPWRRTNSSRRCFQQFPTLFLDLSVVMDEEEILLRTDWHDFIPLHKLDLAVAPVARLLHFQNIPLITMGAVSNEFTLQRQKMYSSLFRFGYRTDELGKFPLAGRTKRRDEEYSSVRQIPFSFPFVRFVLASLDAEQKALSSDENGIINSKFFIVRTKDRPDWMFFLRLRRRRRRRRLSVTKLMKTVNFHSMIRNDYLICS